MLLRRSLGREVFSTMIASIDKIQAAVVIKFSNVCCNEVTITGTVHPVNPCYTLLHDGFVQVDLNLTPGETHRRIQRLEVTVFLAS